jgi:hypothetical protein
LENPPPGSGSRYPPDPQCVSPIRAKEAPVPCAVGKWEMVLGLKLAMEIPWGTGWESGRIEVGCFSDENERGNKHMRFCCSH